MTPTITKARSALSLTCGVAVNIRAPAARVWTILTDAQDFPRWNSTVTRIDGRIRDGEKLRLHAPGTTRTFSPTVSDVLPARHMAWTGGVGPLFKGVRTFDLTPKDDGSTDFTMVERFSGLMIPLVQRSLPDFGPIFAAFAGDLKREAERAP